MIGMRKKKKNPSGSDPTSQNQPAPNEIPEPVIVNPSAEIEQAHHQAYVDERKVLVEGEQSNSAEFDKSILTLSAGALGLSLVFLEKIAPDPLLETIPYIASAWICLT